jgi:CRP-like cAMP-binding protein
VNDSSWPSATLLGRLDKMARDQLLGLGVNRVLGANEPLMHEGRRESHVVVLDDALVKVTVALSDGRQALLAIRVSGDIVGETSALNGTPRSATVTTCREATVRIIARNEFRAFLHGYPDAAIQVAGIVADRLRWANRRRVDFAAFPVRVRLARVLWEIAIAYGRRCRTGIVIAIQLTQAELATMCGAAEISLQKALRDLRAAAIVDTGYRQIVVRDTDALRRVAQVE